MSSFFYSTVPNKVRTFIEQIPSTGVPSKVSFTELTARGFKSSNDRTVIPVLKAIGLIDGSGMPTENWQAYRNRATNKALMAALIRNTYGDLFGMYPDADRRSDQEIKNFFGTRSKAGDRAIQYAVATFRALSSLADFSVDTVATAEEPHSAASVTAKSAKPAASSHSITMQPSVTINIGIQIPEQADSKMIDQIFKSMAVHLYGRVDA